MASTQSAPTPDPQQRQELRLMRFASLFKGYMSVMPIVIASLAPILTLTKVLPVPSELKPVFATFSGLFGFLLLAWIFNLRRLYALIDLGEGLLLLHA